MTALDARVKLLILVSLTTVAVAFRSPAVLAVVLAYTLLLLIAGRVPLLPALKKVRGLLGLAASVFILQCIFNRSGGPLIAVRGVTLITRGGVLAALGVLLRLLIVIFSALIVLTGKRRDYLLALDSLRVPYEISFMVLAGLRFLPMLRDEARDVLSAAEMRGLRIKKAPLGKRLKAYMTLTLPIVAGAVRRSERLSVAMEARAFRANPRRTSMRRLRMRRADWIVLIVHVLAAAAIVTGGILWKRPL